MRRIEEALAHHGDNGGSPGEWDCFVRGDKPARLFVGIWFEKFESGNTHLVSLSVSGKEVPSRWKWICIETTTTPG
jgi:hypothetical protein